MRKRKRKYDIRQYGVIAWNLTWEDKTFRYFRLLIGWDMKHCTIIYRRVNMLQDSSLAVKHRLDGPAVVRRGHYSGSGKEYWVNGEQISKTTFNFLYRQK